MSKRSEKRDVSAEILSTVVDEMRAAVGSAAGPRTWEDSRESWLWRAAHRLGIEQRRAKALWYREAKSISAAEYLTIKARIADLSAQRGAQEARHAENEAAIAALAGPSRAGGQQVGSAADRTDSRTDVEG